MSKTTGIWLIVAAALVLCGGLLFGGVMMFGLDFTDLSTERYETNTYAIGEKFENISIVTDTAEIVFVASEGQEPSVVCHEQKNAKHTVLVQGGTLTIEAQNTKKWYEYIGINLGAPKITVYLPASQYGALSIREQTGNVEIPGDFTFENLDVKASTGQVICRASAAGSGKIQTTTGRILIEEASFRALDLSVSTGKITATTVTCPEKLSVRVTTGKAELTDITCGNLLSDGSTGDILLKSVIAEEKISVERSTGSIKFDGSDAAEIFAKTDTGSVTGTLLSEKVFFAESDTGRVHVPQSTTGGKCEVRTDTGDIKLEIQ